MENYIYIGNLRPYKCSQCDKGYVRKSLLKAHVQTTHENLVFSCKTCKKIIRKKRPHACAVTNGNWKCSKCDLAFATGKSLFHHKRCAHPEKESKIIDFESDFVLEYTLEYTYKISNASDINIEPEIVPKTTIKRATNLPYKQTRSSFSTPDLLRINTNLEENSLPESTPSPSSPYLVHKKSVFEIVFD